MYWLLRLSPSTENSLILHGTPNIMKSLSLDFSIAKPLAEKIPKIEFQIEKNIEGNITDNLLAYGVRAPFLNAKGLSCLTSLNEKDITFIETNIMDQRNDTEYTDYKIININQAIHCVNFDDSKLVLRKNGNIKFIDRLVFNERALIEHGISICRVAEFLPLIIVSDEIKNKMVNLGITGVNFMRPEDLKL